MYHLVKNPLSFILLLRKGPPSPPVEVELISSASSRGGAGDLQQSPAWASIRRGDTGEYRQGRHARPPAEPGTGDLRQMASSASCIRRWSSSCTEAGPWRGGDAWGPEAGRGRGRQSWPARWREAVLAGVREAVLAGWTGRRRGRPVVGGHQAGQRRSLPHMRDFFFLHFVFIIWGIEDDFYIREK
jgi:hypothetical protein